MMRTNKYSTMITHISYQGMFKEWKNTTWKKSSNPAYFLTFTQLASHWMKCECLLVSENFRKVWERGFQTEQALLMKHTGSLKIWMPFGPRESVCFKQRACQIVRQQLVPPHLSNNGDGHTASDNFLKQQVRAWTCCYSFFFILFIPFITSLQGETTEACAIIPIFTIDVSPLCCRLFISSFYIWLFGAGMNTWNWTPDTCLPKF